MTPKRTGEEREFVMRRLRRRENAFPSPSQKLDWRRADRAEVVCCACKSKMKLAQNAVDAQVRIDPAQVGRRAVAPAVIVQHIRAKIETDVALFDSSLRHCAYPPKRSSIKFKFKVVKDEAVLHPYCQCSAQGIQAKSRIVGNDFQSIDCELRNEVPVHGITERLIRPNTVLVNCETLRCSQHRRSGEAPVLHIGLKWIARYIIDLHAWHPLQKGVRHAARNIM